MATNALAVVQPQYEDPKLLQTIKDTVCKGATDAQFRMFIEVCRSTGLNPFLKEVYYVPDKGIIMAARDGYLRVANEHPQFDGMETTVERDDKKVPIKATCRVWRKDRGHPTTCEAYFSEYKKESPVWRQYPSAMISKVAEVLALKRSFSINGVVTEEEIGNSEERGSKEAQQEYLASKGITTDKTNVSPETIRELADELDKPSTIKTIEIRKAAQDAEAAEVLKETKPKGKAKKGIIPFDKLRNWQKVKDELRSFTGTDGEYYAALHEKGYQHANEISTEADALAIWKTLGLKLNQLKQDAELTQLLSVSSDVIGARAFADLLGLHGCLSIGDVLALASEPLEALLAELKMLVDGRRALEAEGEDER